MRYKITCLKCKSARKVGIVRTDGRELIDWLDNHPDPQVTKIISGRKRLDDKWGWSCICGNNDIMTDQESKYIENKQNPSPTDIANVVKNLKPQKPKFAMEKA